MSGRFTGWPEATFDVLLELDGDPPVIVRESLRAKREQLIRQPMIALMQELADLDAVYSNFTVPGFQKMIEPWQRQVGFVRPEHNLALIAARHLGFGGWLHKPAASDRVHAAFEDLRPMMTWFADHAVAIPNAP